jgi:UDP-N-acetylmuramyl pentapeptide synthase
VDRAAATDWLLEHVGPGDVVLLKASHAVGLSAVAQDLLTDPRHHTDPSEGSDR